jgi:hypothetical protein
MPKKIVVGFEFSQAELQSLLTSGGTRRKLSATELKKLAAQGTVRASDVLTTGQMGVAKKFVLKIAKVAPLSKTFQPNQLKTFSTIKTRQMVKMSPHVTKSPANMPALTSRTTRKAGSPKR